VTYLRFITALFPFVIVAFLTRDVLTEDVSPRATMHREFHTTAKGQRALLFHEQLAILQRLWLRPVLFIKCGGLGFVDDEGTVWQGDAGLSTAATYGDISGYNRILLSQLYGSGRNSRHGPIEYKLPLPLGFYSLSLYFMERYQRQAGGSVFDVEVEGNTLLKDLDIVKQVGFGSALKISRDIALYDGILNITVRPTRGIASISGISITPTAP
jgi:hypothetical protein